MVQKHVSIRARRARSRHYTRRLCGVFGRLLASLPPGSTSVGRTMGAGCIRCLLDGFVGGMIVGLAPLVLFSKSSG